MDNIEIIYGKSFIVRKDILHELNSRDRAVSIASISAAHFKIYFKAYKISYT